MITLEAVWTEVVQTRCHRALLMATAHPGEVIDLGPVLAGQRAALAVLATLADAGTTVADPHHVLSEREGGLLGAITAPTAMAAFVLARGDLAAADTLTLATGDLLTPERGATLVLDCHRLGIGALALTCTGPGIMVSRRLEVDGLHPSWLELRARHCARFPLGIDVVLADAQRIAVLPRTTRLIIDQEV